MFDSLFFFFFQDSQFHNALIHLYAAYHVIQNQTARSTFFQGSSLRLSQLVTSFRWFHIRSHVFQKNHFSSSTVNEFVEFSLELSQDLAVTHDFTLFTVFHHILSCKLIISFNVVSKVSAFSFSDIDAASFLSFNWSIFCWISFFVVSALFFISSVFVFFSTSEIVLLFNSFSDFWISVTSDCRWSIFLSAMCIIVKYNCINYIYNC